MIKNKITDFISQAKIIQNKMKKAQEKLSSIEVEGQSGAGMVKVLITCKNYVKRIFIDSKLLNEDKDILEDLIVTAFNDAIKKAEIKSQAKLSKLTENLPFKF
ncbi:YbaB/EbfC family nucleoid-associated protein [Candidatus Profftella armatura (Diaphorina cf. continua)]|uniref:Nucleoid-associated protein PADco_3020 n=1 Tax=Candidatus Profftella armatura (Diaphorina cf. continua) TaxID=2661583 RepID=A0A7R6W0P9_9PROT|nr:YbaB/EbfC family nucleoid-associated protein [Candidatus Profftella armatura (Diaphorina cf. continua)]BCG49722.1 YbaB/EbfC family nucleoid-associated protein [Candidatus Profftella armatura (Diaphorina cf. continua)]